MSEKKQRISSSSTQTWSTQQRAAEGRSLWKKLTQRSHHQTTFIHRKGQRPGPRRGSSQSELQKDLPLFKLRASKAEIHQRPEPEPEPSCVSFKSDRSKKDFINFKRICSSDKKIHQTLKPEPEPEPSCASFKSNWSKDFVTNFKQNVPSAQQIHQRLRPGPEPGAEPEPSCVSMKSDRSMGRPVNFKSDQHPSPQR
ncbi:uncharacterized protein PAE49_012675 [Odontesthes bonariensis]